MSYLAPTPEFRTPPHNLEAEQALLGAILVNNEALSRVNEFLLPAHFYEPLHQRIYTHVVKLIERQQIANPVTLRPFFEQDPAMVEIGGPSYLARLAANAVTVINAGDYGRAIYDLALKRELIQVGEDIVNGAYEPDIDTTAVDLVAAASDRINQIATGNGGESELKFSGELILAELEATRRRRETGSPAGLALGLGDLDRILGGLSPGDLTIIAGRPGMGKSALATCISRLVASRGVGVLFFSLEMSADQLAQRTIAEMGFSGPDSTGYSALRTGQVDDEKLQRLEKIAVENSRIPLVFDTSAAPSMAAIRSKSRRARHMLERRKSNLGLIVVDYLQLIKSSTKYSGNRVQEVTEISAELKRLAVEMQVPVIALSQLSRQVENREDKRPQLADLRESGAIEQDANQVLAVFREEYYLRSSEPTDPAKQAAWMDRLAAVANRCDVTVLKNRMGGTGTATLFFHPASGAFRGLRP